MQAQFAVVENAPVSLLGAQTCPKMDLMRLQYKNIEDPIFSTQSKVPLSREDVLNSFRDVFDDKVIGLLKGEVQLEKVLSIRPVQMPTRKFPVAIQQPLTVELARLVNLRVLTKVDSPSEWISSLAVEKKKKWQNALVHRPEIPE